jgi:hypothetical protein
MGLDDAVAAAIVSSAMLRALMAKVFVPFFPLVMVLYVE